MQTRIAWTGTLVIAGLWIFGAACDGGGTENPTTGSTSTSSSSSGTGGSGGSGGAGGGTTASSSSSSGTGGTGGCASQTDCPGADTECGFRTCNAGVCGMKPTKAAGTTLDSQLYGDCKIAKCDANGGVELQDDLMDFYDDGNPCTVETCVNGDTLHVNQVAGIPCGPSNAGKCDGMGLCARCTISPNSCTSGICVASKNYKDPITLDGTYNKCVPASCTNGIKDNGETDIDCGGSQCAPCATGLACSSNPDCQDVSCTLPAGAMAKSCAMPSCTDGLLNGNETFPDYGGPDCPPCVNAGWGCKVHSDCVSGVCMNAKCAEPTCFDAVKNDDEQGVDCGGACAALCSPP